MKYICLFNIIKQHKIHFISTEACPPNTHVVIGTPKVVVNSRLCGYFDVKSLKITVIDDADMINTSHNFVYHVQNQLPFGCQKLAASSAFNENSMKNLGSAKIMDLKIHRLNHIKPFGAQQSDFRTKCHLIEMTLKKLLILGTQAIIYCQVSIIWIN